MVVRKHPSGMLATVKETSSKQPERIMQLLAAMKKQGTDYLILKSTRPTLEVKNVFGGTGNSFLILTRKGKTVKRVASGTITKVMPYIKKHL